MKLPICEICGKELKNPKNKSHINSAYHQKALKEKKEGKNTYFETSDKSMDQEITKLKQIVANLENRVNILENKFKVKGQINNRINITEINAKKIEDRIINMIQEKSSSQRIKSTVAIKDINDSIKKEFKISEINFIDLMMRLYRKQLIDLQPGGNPRDYHLKSPTGSKFYYVSLKN